MAKPAWTPTGIIAAAAKPKRPTIPSDHQGLVTMCRMPESPWDQADVAPRPQGDLKEEPDGGDGKPAVTLPSWPERWCARVAATHAKIDARERARAMAAAEEAAS